MNTFEYWYNLLPEEIIVDNKHYGIFITPYDISYMAFNEKHEYILLNVINCDMTIKDKTERLVDNLKRVYNWYITYKYNKREP